MAVMIVLSSPPERSTVSQTSSQMEEQIESLSRLQSMTFTRNSIGRQSLYHLFEINIENLFRYGFGIMNS
jgi:hypothetical protein